MLNFFKSKNNKPNIKISDLGNNNIIEIDKNIKFNTASSIQYVLMQTIVMSL